MDDLRERIDKVLRGAKTSDQGWAGHGWTKLDSYVGKLGSASLWVNNQYPLQFAIKSAFIPTVVVEATKDLDWEKTLKAFLTANHKDRRKGDPAQGKSDLTKMASGWEQILESCYSDEAREKPIPVVHEFLCMGKEHALTIYERTIKAMDEEVAQA